MIAAHDVGRAINPQQCEAQIEGAVHMGLGYALTEELPCKDGMPVTFKLREIGVLRAQHMPEVEVILVEEPEPEGPFGAKGVGEIGLVPTAGAVAGALDAFDGVRRMTPADEGFAGRARHQSSAASATATATNGTDDALVVGPDRRGRSVAIDGRPRRRARRPPAPRASPCPDGEIAPGAVCAHTHLYSGLARYGMPPPAAAAAELPADPGTGVVAARPRARRRKPRTPRRATTSPGRCSPA